ncbi:hypothetical protein DV113_000204 [Geotrichum candidum]|uniref:Uncharacterized protein n=1 Tax=Geotrichum candidum TaxID=1173061 RepID=A0A0J9XE82_GEOCN|nr:hypothetical protein DV113_000204 [Geotrichum candidum]CDO55798.1 conserved hypothetical protein [Geotrichum candidum]
MPSNEINSPVPQLQNLFSLEGKAVVITGASGGMASTVSRYLLSAGATFLALLDMDVSALERTQKQLQAEFPGARLAHWVCNVSDEPTVREVLTQVRAAAGQQLNVLINTAGYCENVSALDYGADRVNRLLHVNLTGSMIMATEFARTVLADLGIDRSQPQPDAEELAHAHNQPLHTTASIILIASMSGHIINHPQPQTPYNISKAGVIHLAKSLASEWAQYGIRVNSLSPGYILTPLTRAILERDPALKANWESGVPALRMAEADEFAGPIIFMSADASSYMTGADLVVDGGYTIR